MSRTVQQIQSWLISPDAIKVILIEVIDVNLSTTYGDITTIFLSSRAYISSDTNQLYNPCIVGGISYTEKLNLEGKASLNYGDIELDNTDGSNDAYLKYIWKNRAVNIYIGDVRWPKSDFSLVFSGIVGNITARNRNTINLTILDTLAKMNTALSEELVGSGAVGPDLIPGYNGSLEIIYPSSENKLRPLCFGECFNVPATPISESYYYSGSTYGAVYQVHNGPIEGVLEVYDNGAPVDFIQDVGSGTFALINSSYGTITASVQGAKPGGTYSDELKNVITNILTNYGTYPLSAGDLDFPAGSTPYVGYFCDSRENVIDVCNKLAESGGYQLINTTVTAYVGSATNVAAAGKVKLIYMDPASATNVYDVTDNDMLFNSMRVEDILPVRSSTKLNYCTNWNPETTLAEALAPSTTSYFRGEYLVNRYTSSNNQAVFLDSDEPVEEDSYLINTTQAQTEATRRSTLLGTPRYIVTATYLPHMIFAQLGDGITITTSNSKFSSIVNGKQGMIYSIDRNWLNSTITIGVLI